MRAYQLLRRSLGTQPIATERWCSSSGTAAVQSVHWLEPQDQSLIKTRVCEQVRELSVAAGTVLGAMILKEPMSCHTGFGVASMIVGAALVCV
eukprot:COSAG02_NODE_3754_length_6280_cov_3.493933_2_plen_93_part_00